MSFDSPLDGHITGMDAAGKGPPRLALRPEEMAESLGVCERTLQTWGKKRGFPRIRVDNIVLHPVDQVLRWLAAQQEEK